MVVLRNLSLLLRPSMLDDLGLVPALKWQAREVARRSGLKIKVDAEDVADDLPDEYRTCIFRVVQEALHNVTRHAKATQVTISVTRGERGVSVRIQDNGAGFQTRKKRAWEFSGWRSAFGTCTAAFTSIRTLAKEPRSRWNCRSHPRANWLQRVHDPMTRILLADDHAVMRTGLRLVLERQPDFEVVGEASDGREAVAMAQKLTPDVVVMDIGMPNLNGIEAARQIGRRRAANCAS